MGCGSDPLYTYYPAAGGRTQRTLKGDTGANAAGARDRDARDTQKKISRFNRCSAQKKKTVVRVLNAILLFDGFLGHDQMWRRVCYRG
jgi:hypothetical protein